MARNEVSKNTDGPSFQGPRFRPNWATATTCFVLATYLIVALLDYEPAQSTIRSTAPTAKNLVGWLGADSVWALLACFGVTAWLFPIFIYWMMYVAVRNARRLVATRAIAMIVAIIAGSGLSAMMEGYVMKTGDYFPYGPGGLVGVTLYKNLLAEALGPFGSGLLLVTVYLFALLFVITKDIGSEMEKIMTAFADWRANRAKRKAELAELRAKEKEERAKAKTAAPVAPVAVAPVGPQGSKKLVLPKAGDDPLKAAALARATEETKAAPAIVPKPEEKPPLKLTKPAPAPVAAPAEPAGSKIALNIVKPEEPKKAAGFVPPKSDSSYIYPPRRCCASSANSESR